MMKVFQFTLLITCATGLRLAPSTTNLEQKLDESELASVDVPAGVYAMNVQKVEQSDVDAIVAKRYNKISYFDGSAGDLKSSSKFKLKAPKSILIFGSSVDKNAVGAACRAMGKENIADELRREAFCELGDFKILHAFNPGSGEPPYWQHDKLIKRGLPVGNGMSQYLQQYVKEFVAKNLTASPDLIVVDTSLWDLSQWWEMEHGKDATWKLTKMSTETVPEERLQKWCHKDVPKHLELVQEAFPKSTVVFRTAPTVASVSKRYYGAKNMELATTVMSQCITKELQGKNDIIDYHEIMSEHIKRKGEALSFRPDDFHPSGAVSLEYISEVLNYANEH